MGKSTTRSEIGQFAAMPHAVLKTRKYASLDGWAAKLLLDLTRQYNGRNNGDLTAAWTVMREHGWRSKGTLNRAIKRLREVGFIVTTRQGWNRNCSLYALTWHPIDECMDREGRHKHDAKPTLRPPGCWKDKVEPLDPPPKTESAVPIRTAAVPMRTETKVNGTHADRTSEKQYTYGAKHP